MPSLRLVSTSGRPPWIVRTRGDALDADSVALAFQMRAIPKKCLKTAAVVTVEASDVRPISQREMTHARELSVR